MKPADATEIFFLSIFSENTFRSDYACTTRPGIDRKLDEWVQTGWHRYFPGVPMPEDHKEALEYYFNHAQDRFEIHSSLLHSTCRCCGRQLPADMICRHCFPQKQEYQDVIEEEE